MGKHSAPETPKQKCPNGHDANSNGNCFENGCAYANTYRHDGIGR